MTRESRHLKICGFSDNVTEEMLLDHFSCYGRVQKVEFLKDEQQNNAVVSFMDLRTAANAINADHEIRGHTIKATYYEPGGSTLNTVIQIHDSSEALHSSAQHRRQAFGQQNYQRSQNRSQNWFNSSSASDQRAVGNRHAASTEDQQTTFVHSNAAGGSRSNAVAVRRGGGQKRPSSRLSSGRNNRRPSASSNSSGDESCSRSRSRSSQSSRSASLTASSRGSRRTIGGGSSRYSVDSRGRPIMVGDGERHLNSKDGGDGNGGGSSSGNYKNSSILVRNLPLRSTDSSLKDGLFFTYKKHGKVVSVKVVGEGPERYAVVTFRRSSDTQKAIDSTNNVMFFGSKISVEIAPSGLDVDDNERRPLEKDIDQYHPKSSRTLYVGNLENRITPEQLRVFFERFGDVIDVDIKNRETPAPFAFIQFTDIVSVVKAIHSMEQDGYIGNNKIKVGFGKPLPSPMVWIDELPEHVSSEYLSRKMNFYGSITDILIDKVLHQSLITYDCIEAAQCAVLDMKVRTICNRKVQIDFCSRELHDLFVDRMFRTNQLRGREAIYMNESLLPSSASQRLSMSRGNSYEIPDFYPVESYYESGSTSSKNYGGPNNNRRSGPDSKHNRTAPFEERQSYDYPESEFDEYESSNRDFNRSQEQNQRNAYRTTKGRSLTPPQASRHSNNRGGHRETDPAAAPAGWNAQQQRSQQEEYRATNKRPRSPPTVPRPGVDVTASKKRSSSIDRTDYRQTNARHDSRETSNDYYSRTESPNNFNRIGEQQQRHNVAGSSGVVGGTLINAPRDFNSTSLKKPRTPPMPKEKRKKTNSSSSDDSTTADGSSNGSSSSSSSDDSSSDLDSVEGAAGATSNEKGKNSDQQQPGPSAGAPPPVSQNHLNVVSSAVSKDPSPDMQKLQRDRARLLQMLETLDGEEGQCIIGEGPSCSGKKLGDKKTLPLSEIFDLDWVKCVAAVRKRENTRSTEAQLPTGNAEEPKSSSTLSNVKGFLCRQTSVDDDGNSCDGGVSCSKDNACGGVEFGHRRPPPIRRRSSVIENIRSMDADDVAGPIAVVGHGELLRRSSTLSRKNSLLTSSTVADDFLEFNSPSTTLRTNNNLPNLNKKKDSIIIKQEHLQEEFCADDVNTKQASIVKCDVVGDSASVAATSNLSSSVPKNELSTPARASLSLKSRKIPLELIDNEEISDPRLNRPKIIIINDLPVPHFAFKKTGMMTSIVTTSTTLHQSSPLKSTRPDLKIETSSSTVTSQGIIQAHSQHMPLQQTRSSSGSDLSPLLSNGGDVSAGSDALMSPPSAGSVCWPTPSTDIFGESLSPVTPVSAEMKASFEERIKALDDKFTEIDRMMKITKERPMHRSTSTTAAAAANVDYSKYKVVKKPSNPLPPPTILPRSMSSGNALTTAPQASSSSSSASNFVPTTPVPSSSALTDVKSFSLLPNKSSVFDRDLERLASIEEKFTPVISIVEVAKPKMEDLKDTKEPVALLRPPLTINIPPPSGAEPIISTTKSTHLPTPPLSSAPQPVLPSPFVAAPPTPTPLSPTGPLQGILKNKPKTPTTCPPMTLFPTTPITPVTPLENRSLPGQQQPMSATVASSSQLPDARVPRKDCLKSPTNENLTRTAVSTSTTNPIVKQPSDPRQINAGSINRPSVNTNIVQRQSESSNDGRPRLPSTPSTPTSYNVDPRLLGRSATFTTTPKQEKTFGLRHYDRPTTDAKAENSLSTNTPGAGGLSSLNKDLLSKNSMTKVNDGHPKELRNKDLDKLFKNNKSSGDPSSSIDRSSVGNDSLITQNSFGSKNSSTNRLPKIKKKSSNVEKDNSTKSSKGDELHQNSPGMERKKEGVSSEKKSLMKDTDKEKKKEKDRLNEKFKDKEKLQKMKYKMMTNEERRQILKEKHRQFKKQQQESKENYKKSMSSSAAKQAREEKLNKLIKQKRLKTTGKSKSSADGSGSDDDSSSTSSSDDEEMSAEKRAAKKLEKEWKQAYDACGEPVGLSMYDRVKRRSSATYSADPWKKTSGKDKFSRLREQRNFLKNNRHRRVKCEDDSTNCDDDDDDDDENDDKNSLDDDDNDGNSSATVSIVEQHQERDRDRDSAEKYQKKSYEEIKKRDKKLKKQKKDNKEKLCISDVWSDESSSASSDENVDNDYDVAKVAVAKSSDDSEKEKRRSKEKEQKHKNKIHSTQDKTHTGAEKPQTVADKIHTIGEKTQTGIGKTHTASEKEKSHASVEKEKHHKPQKIVSANRRDSNDQRRSLKEKTLSSSSPQKRGPGRPKKTREPSESDEKQARIKSPSSASKKDSSTSDGKKEKEKDKEKKKHKIKKDKEKEKSSSRNINADSSSPAKKKSSKHADVEYERDKTKDSVKKRKRLNTSSTSAENDHQSTTKESKKIKLELNSPTNPNVVTSSSAVPGSSFISKACLKQYDLTPPVSTTQPVLITKAAKKAIEFGSTTKEKTPEKASDQQATKHMPPDEQRCVIQSLDHAEISADIVQALKMSVGPDEPMESEPIPIEVSVQEVVIADADREDTNRESSIDSSVSPKIHPTMDDESKTDDEKALVIDEVAPTFDPLGALSVTVDELGENLHTDLSEQKSDVSSHVDEVIDDVVHGYIEIEPEKLIKLGIQQSQQQTSTKISPVESAMFEQSRNIFEKQKSPPIFVSSTANELNYPPSSSVAAVAPTSSLASNFNQFDLTLLNRDHQIAEGLFATAQQQRQDLMMLRHLQNSQEQPSTPQRQSSMSDNAQSVAALSNQSGLSQQQQINVPSSSSASMQFNPVHTPPSAQFPSFLATSTPMNHIQAPATAPTPPYPPRVPSGGGTSLTLPPYATALYDMQMQQKLAWAAAGLQGPNAMAGIGRFAPTSATSLPNVLEHEHREQQQTRFMEEQRRQAAASAAAVQVQQLQRLHSVSSTPSFSANTPSSMQHTPSPMAATNPHQNDPLMSHRWLLERYPVIWQGYLALKNDNALVQMHLVSGNPQLLPHSLPGATESSPIPVLRIMQRMRLEPQQLDGVGRRMQLKEEHCVLVVLPCGQDRNHIIQQSTILNTAFINYLQQKQAAGIVNIVPAGATQPTYVVHVFPPCEFAQQSLMGTALDFLHSIVERQTSFLFVVVTTVQGT